VQVRENPKLLDLMLQDMNSASYLYKPTNYWQNYVKFFQHELKLHGLHDFRRRKNSVLATFGGNDIDPIHYVAYTPESIFPPTTKKFVRMLLRFLLRKKSFENQLAKIAQFYFGLNLNELRCLFYEYAKLYGEQNGAKPISNLSASTVGNPENVVTINSNSYTDSFLYHYVEYAYCCKFINFESIESIMELGSGAGTQVEILKKLYPHLTFYLFDIPPQLYVCEQYLTELFPESVISYKETRELKSIPQNTKGKIFFLGPWKLPQLEDFRYDLFWNDASLQEMEPEIVLNYLKFVNQQAKFAYMNERMEGTTLVQKKGQQGVLKQTKLDHYKKGLKDFILQDMSKPTSTIRGISDYCWTFWKKSNSK
jgi:putative sugar O-methyltransferase